MMDYKELKEHITERGIKYQNIGDDDVSLGDSIAMRVIERIFRYCIENDIEFEGFDLKLILDGDEDDLPNDRYEILFDLMRRIEGNVTEGTINASQDVNKLLDHYNRSFYPTFYGSN